MGVSLSRKGYCAMFDQPVGKPMRCEKWWKR